MSLSPERIAAIEHLIEGLWTNAGLCASDYPTIVPISALMDAFNLRFIEERGLTLAKVAAQLESVQRTLEVQKGSDRPLAGFLYVEPLDAWLFVKADDPIARRRFSAAHELGHLVLHWNPDQTVFRDGLSFRFSPEEEARRGAGETGSLTAPEEGVSHSLTLADLEQMEQEANLFAARLLMPEATCLRLWRSHRDRFGARPLLLARRLATDLLVSPLAMKIRLYELGLLS